MSGLIRRAGTGRFVDGTDVVWSVAEGQKGRRWREVRSRNGVVVSSLLLETFPDRRFAHMELSTAAGLLTLHPEEDATLHGNAVGAAGVRHVVGLAWPEGSVLVVDGSAVAIAAAAWFLASKPQPADPHARWPVVLVDPALEVTASSMPADALSHDRLDGDGLPVLDGAATWPLELEPG